MSSSGRRATTVERGVGLREGDGRWVGCSPVAARDDGGGQPATSVRVRVAAAATPDGGNAAHRGGGKGADGRLRAQLDEGKRRVRHRGSICELGEAKTWPGEVRRAEKSDGVWERGALTGSGAAQRQASSTRAEEGGGGLA
ncbi:hypothetical protein E2562_034711 [Oryza meyeriana var. granulata]|uniref:DUF834 domain-containing protein n=1 Tax=Oryza meyeriana var. granulata TaxID=110450 RepID=A0A6G1CAL3_9ORYZ|nr:hypothetical protein E2562_034711 [Oryza meyeriana var. granulata]